MKILYNFPSRSRPSKCIAAIDNIYQMARHDDWSILCKIDSDDQSMNNDVMIERLCSYDRVSVTIGECKTKVEAVNRDLPYDYSWRVLLTHSDDMLWMRPGFDLMILKHYQEGFRGLLHVMEQYSRSRLVTYPIMHREYFELDGHVYDPIYDSVFCDGHQHRKSEIRGMYKLHPEPGWLFHAHYYANRAGQMDALLKRNEDPATYAKDKRTFDYQESINFGL